MPARKYQAQFGVAINILCLDIYIEKLRHLASKNEKNKQMHCQILPRRTCNTCDLYDENEFQVS